MSNTETRKQRWTLIAILAVFFVPVLVAMVLNSRWVDWKPEAEGNHGELVVPVVPLPDGLKRSLQTEMQWVLISACEVQCGQRADLLDRMDRALGRNADKFTPVLAVASDPHPADIPPSVHTVDYAGWQRFLTDAVAGGEAAYLIDPLGNVMMRYDAPFDPSAALEDLERLIKYSRFQ